MTPAGRCLGRHSGRRCESGIGLLGVLLFTTVIVGVLLSYARHALLEAAERQASVQAETVRSTVSSGLTWCQQSLLAGGSRTKTLATPDGGKVKIDIVDTSVTGRVLTIQSSGGLRTQKMEAVADVFLTSGSTLPVLTATASQLVNRDPTLIDVNRDKTYTDTVINGILLVRPGVQLTLTDVVLNGSILSEPALTGRPATSFASATVIISGGLRIQPASVLGSCAIVAPGCTVRGSDRVEIHGVVIADRFDLAGTGSGTVTGDILTITPLPSALTLDRPGAGRAPRPWPRVLTQGAEALQRMSFPRRVPSTTEQQAIDGFGFPVRATAK